MFSFAFRLSSFSALMPYRSTISLATSVLYEVSSGINIADNLARGRQGGYVHERDERIMSTGTGIEREKIIHQCPAGKFVRSLPKEMVVGTDYVRDG